MITNSEPSHQPAKARFFGVHAKPQSWFKWFLGALPFLVIIVLYNFASDARLAENPQDKLLPSFSKMYQSMVPMITKEDPRTGKLRFWADTKSSLLRLTMGVGAAYLLALWLGINMGSFGGLSALSGPILSFVSMIPPLALLPILFISLGINELGKVALIFLGTFPAMARDIYLATNALPKEQLTKTLTLGGSQSAYVYRIALPQILPRSIDTLRLYLGAAWLFVIAAEAIAATEGLGYRIFLVRRYLSMDIIIPYVAWITVIGFFLDYSLRMLRLKFFPWYQGGKAK